MAARRACAVGRADKADRHLAAFRRARSEMALRLGAFRKEFDRLGWSEGRNVSFDYRWAAGVVERLPGFARELLGGARGDPGAKQSRRGGFAKGDPHDPDRLRQRRRPGRQRVYRKLGTSGGEYNGVHAFEPPMGGNWLEALKNIAPAVTRVVVLLHADTAVHAAFLRSAEAAAPSLGLVVSAANVRDAAEIERAITAFATELNGGLIVMPNPVTVSESRPYHRPGGPASAAGGVCVPFLRSRGRLVVLRGRPSRHVSAT